MGFERGPRGRGPREGAGQIRWHGTDGPWRALHAALEGREWRGSWGNPPELAGLGAAPGVTPVRGIP